MKNFHCDNPHSACFGGPEGVRLDIPPAGATMRFKPEEFQEFMDGFCKHLEYTGTLGSLRVEVKPDVVNLVGKKFTSTFQTREFMAIVYAYYLAQNR